MVKDKIPCPRCGALNEPIAIHCFECGYSLNVSTSSEIIQDNQSTNQRQSTEFNGSERHFIIEHFRDTHDYIKNSEAVQESKPIASLSSGNTKLFTIERPTVYVVVYISVFLIFFLAILILLLETHSAIYIIIGIIGLYIGSLVIGRNIYFKAYDARTDSNNTNSNRVKVIQMDKSNGYKIGLKQSFLGVANVFTRTNWVLSDGKGMKICSMNVTNLYEGFLETSEDTFIVSSVPAEETGMYFLDLLSFNVHNKSGLRLITINNPPLDHKVRYLKRFEILSSPDLDDRIVMFFSFVIMRKLLNIPLSG